MKCLNVNALPSTPRNHGQNEWADFIELACLCSDDGEISASDIESRFYGEDAFEVGEAENELGEKDERNLTFVEYFDYIHNREQSFGDYYPFKLIDQDTITVSAPSDNIKQMLYLFLLVASNTRYVDSASRSTFTKQFELLSLPILRMMYPSFTCEVFGTAAEPGSMFHGGTVRSRIERFASALNAFTTPEVENDAAYSSSSGDGGLDLVAYLPIDLKQCPAARVPVCLAQCKCSYEDWIRAQTDVSSSRWRSKVIPFVTAHELMFVPFPIRDSNGAWHSHHASDAITTVVDRMRFVSIIERYGKGDLSFFATSKAYDAIAGMV